MVNHHHNHFCSVNDPWALGDSASFFFLRLDCFGVMTVVSEILLWVFFGGQERTWHWSQFVGDNNKEKEPWVFMRYASWASCSSIPENVFQQCLSLLVDILHVLRSSCYFPILSLQFVSKIHIRLFQTSKNKYSSAFFCRQWSKRVWNWGCSRIILSYHAVNKQGVWKTLLGSR